MIVLIGDNVTGRQHDRTVLPAPELKLTGEAGSPFNLASLKGEFLSDSRYARPRNRVARISRSLSAFHRTSKMRRRIAGDALGRLSWHGLIQLSDGCAVAALDGRGGIVLGNQRTALQKFTDSAFQDAHAMTVNNTDAIDAGH